MQWKYLISKRKKMELLTKKQQDSHENPKNCYISKEKLENKYFKDKIMIKLERSLSLYRGI